MLRLSLILIIQSLIAFMFMPIMHADMGVGDCNSEKESHTHHEEAPPSDHMKECLDVGKEILSSKHGYSIEGGEKIFTIASRYIDIGGAQRYSSLTINGKKYSHAPPTLEYRHLIGIVKIIS